MPPPPLPPPHPPLNECPQAAWAGKLLRVGTGRMAVKLVPEPPPKPRFTVGQQVRGGWGVRILQSSYTNRPVGGENLFARSDFEWYYSVLARMCISMVSYFP